MKRPRFSSAFTLLGWFAPVGYLLLISTDPIGSTEWFGHLLVLLHVMRKTLRSDVQ